MRIFQCFMFHDELDLLEIRLKETYELCDRFVIGEATTTHQGNPKPLWYADNKERFSPFKDKIKHLVIANLPRGSNTWVAENYQRNALLPGIADADPDDVIFLCDADEIPSATSIPKCIRRFDEFEFVRLGMQHYIYYLNMRLGSWLNAFFFRFSTFSDKIHSLQRARTGHLSDVRQCVHWDGWHFSFLGGVEGVKRKAQNGAVHAGTDPNLSRSETWIADCIANGRPIVGYSGGNRAVVVPLDGSFPQCIIEERERYRHLIAPQENHNDN